MQNIKEQIEQKLNEAVSALGLEIKAELEQPKDPTHGDWSSNIAMRLTKELKKNPLDIAGEVAAKVSSIEYLDKVEVVAPGFINFYISPSFYKQVLPEVLEKQKKFGEGISMKGKRIMMEFAHPNPFKSFHIGHLRNIILGESLIRLLEAQGAEVIRVNYQGDVGMHIAKCLWSFQKVDPKDYPENADAKVALLGKCYAEGASVFETDEIIQREIKDINKKIYTKEDKKITGLWDLGKQWSLEKFHEIYKRVYTTFEREYMESEVLDKCMEYIDEALEKGILEKSDGAVVFKGKDYGLDTRVFLNSEGLPTYEGKELGLAYKEFTDYGHIDLCIHNVAVEQISFFKVTFKVEELLDEKLFKDKQYHNAYEFVGLKKGKMSSRKGNVILGNDILNEAHEKIKMVIEEKGSSTNDIEATAEILGIAAVKYSYLKISPFTYLAFDLDESLSFEGDSGPYLMYVYARIQSLISKDGASDLLKQDVAVEDVLNSSFEISLLKQIYNYSAVLTDSIANYSPNILCTYLYKLSQEFNRFYDNLSVLNAENEPDKIARLKLTAATAQVLKNGLNLLGIETVEKM